MTTEKEKSEAVQALNWLLYHWNVEKEFPRPVENETLAQYIIRIQNEALEAIDEAEQAEMHAMDNDGKEPPHETTEAD